MILNKCGVVLGGGEVFGQQVEEIVGNLFVDLVEFRQDCVYVYVYVVVRLDYENLDRSRKFLMM